jgi:5-methylcytosine-specific restriction endonuclease McrA
MPKLTPEEQQSILEEKRAKHAAYMRAYTAANAEKINQQRRERHAADPEHNRTAANKRYARNPTPIQQHNRAYQQRNAEQLKEKARAYSAAHRKENKIRWKAWKARNIEKERERVRLAQRNRAPQVKAALQAWRKANPDKARLQVEKRRARKHNAPVNDLTLQQWQGIQAAHKHCCAYCGKQCKGKLTQDHVTPLSKGGSHTMQNVVPACASCNSRKSNGPAPLHVQPMLL